MSAPAALVDRRSRHQPRSRRGRRIALRRCRAGGGAARRRAGRRPEATRRRRPRDVAGGFSYGDALGAGRVMALELVGGDGGRLGEALRAFVASGRPVLGVCNGFQVLTRCGLVPGALGHNESGHFDCRWVRLAPERARTRCGSTVTSDEIHAPIAHGEGRYVHDDPGGARRRRPGRPALRVGQPQRLGRRHRRRQRRVRCRARTDAPSGEPHGRRASIQHTVAAAAESRTSDCGSFRAGVRHASGL